MNAEAATSGGSSTLLAWLRLFRAPNVFTAIADIAMGFLVVRGSYQPLGLFVSLALASALIYTAGMVLNDVFDIEIDRKERPFRPIPSGQIRLPQARVLGLTMLGAGVVFGTLAGYLYSAALPWRSGLIAIVLAGCVLLYDGWLKRRPIGPLGMGLCRFFNVLLGMSAARDLATGWPLGYGPMHLLPAAGIGIYILGVTIFAKGEAGQSSVAVLLAGMSVMSAGVGTLGWAAPYLARQDLTMPVYWMLLAILLATLLRRCLMAVLDPSSQRVQAGVKSAIFSLVLFDAAVALAAAPAIYSLGIVLLLLPMFLLGRFVYST
jgi:4-hydroxybenzoate polyprenyltransferase